MNLMKQIWNCLKIADYLTRALMIEGRRAEKGVEKGVEKHSRKWLLIAVLDRYL